MLFTFRRDDEGYEAIYVDDVRVAVMAGKDEWSLSAAPPRGVVERHFLDAIERADEDGFWGDEWCDDCGTTDCHTVSRKNEVTVDVSVAENAVLSVTLGGDES